MIIEGDYRQDGYALLKGFVEPEICHSFLNMMKADIERAGSRMEQINSESALLVRGAIEIYGYHYPPMLMFLWGLTPIVSNLAGKDLVPTYNYFRIYREGDICRVHSDRASCEHSISLTLDYSDGAPWDLEIGAVPLIEPKPDIADDFEGAPYTSLRMAAGDAVIYNGVHRRHGRITGNPNAWSAHLFCHWVERDGRYAEAAFDGNRAGTRPVNLHFA